MCAELINVDGCFTKLKLFRLKLFNDWTENVMNPLLIVWTQIDPMKDLILVTRMMIILGGPRIVFTHPNIFSSCVSH